MISKEEFEELIREHSNQSKRVDKLCEVFPESFENPIIDWGFRMFDKLLNAYFDEEGEDWINYFLYENPKECYYCDNKRIPLETLDDLWLLIESHRK